MRLRRTAVPILLWCAATAASIAVASLALRPVLRTAVPADTVPLPVNEAREPGRGAADAPSLPPLPPSRVPPEDPAPTTAAPSPTRTARPPTSPAGRPPTVVDGWTVTTEADGRVTYLRSFRTEGGDAVIRIRDERVSLVTATPRNGYSVSRSQTEPNRLVVQFVGAGDAYLVDAMWWQNAPFGQVSKLG